MGLTTNNNASATNSTATKHHLVRYLQNAGISWRTYQEDIDGTVCPLTSDELFGRYVAKHNPFVFFRDLTDNNNPNSSYCIAHSRPFTELATDLGKNTIARYNFITPNLCNDMHDCGSPLAKVNYANSIHYTHSSTLRTMQEIFGVRPLLRDAAKATDLSDLFTDSGAGGPGKGH